MQTYTSVYKHEMQQGPPSIDRKMSVTTGATCLGVSTASALCCESHTSAPWPPFL